MVKIYSLFIALLMSIGLAHEIPVGYDDSIYPVTSLKAQKINSIGEFNGLVILVEFSDTHFTIPAPKDSFSSLLNAEGYNYQGAKGSVRDYFITNSDSLFFPNFNVVGPIRLPKPMAY